MKVKIGKFPKGSVDRRIDIEIDRYDTWNLDHTLALIILPALIQLKQQKHGVPNDIVSDVGGEDWSSQQCFDFYSDTHAESFDIACKKWDEILDKMIWSFQQIALGDYNDKYHHGEIKIGWTKEDSLGLSTMIDENPDEHWYDHVGHMMHEDRIQEGLELFGKYYRSLWD